MLLSFGVRRHMVHAAPEPSYEAMLALDENNPRRGVKKQILEQLPHVRKPASSNNRQPSDLQSISSVTSVLDCLDLLKPARKISPVFGLLLFCVH